MSIARKILMGAAGAGSKSTYVDDLFSTYLYTGNQGTQTITNGIDFAGEGGMVWCKSRSSGHHEIADTVRGTATGNNGGRIIRSNDNAAQSMGDNGHGFTSSGFTLGYVSGDVNNANQCSSWSFRKAPGFFDIVTYTGNGSNRTIAHNLGSVPGCIIIKCTSSTHDWTIFHRGVAPVDPASYRLRLNATNSRQANGGYFNSTEPTSTHFSLGSNDNTNANGETFIAYIFAGGASTAATNRCVDFDGNDALTSATSSDLSLGTGDYTIEFWFNADAIGDTPLFENRVSGSSGDTTGFTLTAHGSTNGVRIWWNGSSRINGGGSSLSVGKWLHLAVTRSSGTTYLFLDGILIGTTTDAINLTSTEAHIGGGKYSGSTGLSHYFNGRISNFRLIKGTALYTSSFKPPYEPLTNVTNTKLLCCQSSTATTATVAPGTITAVGNPTVPVDASGTFSDSPFDDPEGFIFGEGGDQNLIKCGSYVGQSGANKVYLGWEPQWVMVKNVDSSEPWVMMDSMRGWVNQSSGAISLRANSTGNESAYGPWGPTATGWELDLNQREIDQNDQNYVYIAIRRPDGLVGKPAEAGTDAFAMDIASGSSSIPTWDSGFPVDFRFHRTPAASGDWYTGSRLTGGGKWLATNSANAEANITGTDDDCNTGFGTGHDSSFQAWMWKRGQGMDVVTYKGNSVAGRQVSHSLGRVPEMMWVKNITGSNDWRIYHSGVVGGRDGSGNWNTDSNAAKYQLYLNNSYWAVNNTSSFNETEPTLTTFTLGTTSGTNASGNNYVNYLFSSVAGTSKVGNYTGSSSALTITTGFSPRFVIIKNIKNTGNNWTTGWFTFDTTRGWAAGNNDKRMRLNDTAAQSTEDWTNPISTGFTINANSGNHLNNNGDEYIYYAHA